jgi:hypothetical protein
MTLSFEDEDKLIVTLQQSRNVLAAVAISSA